MDVISHGADIYTASKNTKIDEADIIDFSSNINPLGLPKSVGKSIVDSIKHADKYPDIHSRKLISSLSCHEEVSEDWIFCSNGAAEAIYRITLYLKPKSALLTAPTFGEYEQALKTVGTNIKYYNLREKNKFKITEDILLSITHDIDIIFICNPNNPTGQITSNILLEKIINYCKNTNTVVVIDECFIDFVKNNEKYSVKKLLNKYDNLIILKAFTKIYAMAGIRLGYCLSSNKELIHSLKAYGPPWNISTIAQYAGVEALKEKEYLKETVKYIEEQRNYLVEELNKLYIKTFEGYANYIFFKFTENIYLYEELLKRGILIRPCSNYKNLNSEYFRIAVKSEEDNKILINKIQEIKENI